MKCPGCGAEVSTRTAEKVVACRYCETEIRNPDPAELPPPAPEPEPEAREPDPEPEPETETGEELAEAKDWTGDVKWQSFEESVEHATGVDVTGGAKGSGCAVLLAVLGGLAATALAIA